jgi:hypothetical protein
MATVKAQPMSGERKKLLFLAGLLVFFVAMVVWNMVPSSKTATPPPPTNKAGRVNNSDLAAGGQAPGAALQDLPGDAPAYGPIEPLPPLTPGGGQVSIARNVFAYPPPPKPPPPQAATRDEPPPPPIPIGGVTPSTVIAGSSRPLTITLNGNHIPVDAKVFWNGQPLETQFLNRTAVRATVPPSAYSSARPVQLEVKSMSQPDRLYSRQVPFQLTPSPEPAESLTYTGRIGTQAVISIKDDKRPKLVGVGETINGSVPWKVLAINDRQVELLDTRNDIRKSLALAAKAR